MSQTAGRSLIQLTSYIPSTHLGSTLTTAPGSSSSFDQLMSQAPARPLIHLMPQALTRPLIQSMSQAPARPLIQLMAWRLTRPLTYTTSAFSSRLPVAIHLQA